MEGAPPLASKGGHVSEFLVRHGLGGLPNLGAADCAAT